MIVAMAGGGTGGHVFPAVAVAHELKRRGHEPVFFGTRAGYESRLVPAEGFRLEFVEIGGLNRVGMLQKLKSLYQLPASTLAVWEWMGAHGPAVVFSMGGYVAGPVVLAARLRNLPCVVMEPNAIPGYTHRRMAPWAARALVNFEETARFFPKAEVTGVPVRREFFDVRPKTPGPGPFTLLVTGGSQGSRTLNNAGAAAWPELARLDTPLRVIHQAGRGNAGVYEEAFRSSGVAGELVEFIGDMPSAFASADLIVCRAGASTVSELAAAGRPSVLVPFPFAADDHQKHNAEAMVRAGAARSVTDAEMTGERLVAEVKRALNVPEELARMAEAARKLSRPDPAARAASVLEEVAAEAGTLA